MFREPTMPQRLNRKINSDIVKQKAAREAARLKAEEEEKRLTEEERILRKQFQEEERMLQYQDYLDSLEESQSNTQSQSLSQLQSVLPEVPPLPSGPRAKEAPPIPTNMPALDFTKLPPLRPGQRYSYDKSIYDGPITKEVEFILQQEKLREHGKTYNEKMANEGNDFEWTPEDEEEVQAEVRSIQEGKGKYGKRPPAQVILDRAEVAKYMRRGWSLDMIAEKMECSVQQVAHDWKMVVSHSNKYRKEDVEAKKQSVREQYAEIMREAWEAWERCKLPYLSTTQETEKSLLYKVANTDDDYDDDSPSTSSKSLTKSNNLGSDEENSEPRLVPVKRKLRKTKETKSTGSEYLKIILECLKAIREIEGLNAAKNINVQGTIDWDVLVQTNISDDLDDSQEAKIVAAMGYGGDVYKRMKEVNSTPIHLPDQSNSYQSSMNNDSNDDSSNTSNPQVIILTKQEEDNLIREAINGRGKRRGQGSLHGGTERTTETESDTPDEDRDYPGGE